MAPVIEDRVVAPVLPDAAGVLPGGPPRGNGPDDRSRRALLIALVVIVAVAAVVTAVVIGLRRDDSAAATTTVINRRSGMASLSPPSGAGVPVPNVTGTHVQAAVQTLARTGFLVTIAYVTARFALGTVVAESPGPLSTAPRGSTIALDISSGPDHNSKETVPDVRGGSTAQAASSLQHAGLRLISLQRKVTNHSLAGKVVAQTPAAGKKAPESGQVLVWVGA
jgi:hypothetical protein